jgi:hypothetical protein
MVIYFIDDNNEENFKKRSFTLKKVYPRFKGGKDTLFKKTRRIQSIVYSRVKKGYYMYNEFRRYSHKKIQAQPECSEEFAKLYFKDTQYDYLFRRKE